ncbi:flagellar basal body protein [Microbaculum sp. FT89]|uniref:flagellar basal body protein n=1 Tax=Microbaculum sp. FT89 TaxID=3447298 RepID=UPI003F52E31B
MSIAELPIFSALKSKMSWLQARQTILAANVANADTPGYRANDVETFVVPGVNRVPTPGRIAPVATHSLHLAGFAGSASPWGQDDKDTFEVTPSRNSVVLEEEMMKIAETQLDYQMATGLYARGIGLLKTALGRRA